MSNGAYSKIASSNLFSTSWYLEHYPDVAQAGVDPLKHYIRYGAREGRDPGPNFSTASYLARYREEIVSSSLNPLLHYLNHGQEANHDVSPLFTQRSYQDFQEYLKLSLLSPTIPAPFSTVDKSIFAAMKDTTNMLRQQQEQSRVSPLVSVIMPVHNRADLVGIAIASVLAQSYRNLELIVVDDGSSDGTSDVVKTFTDPRIQLVECSQRGGVSSARNQGLSRAKGELIAYLDSDNTWESEYLRAMTGAFELLPDAGAAYSGQYLYRGNDTEPFALRFIAFNPSLLLNINYIDLNCFMHRRMVLDQLDHWFCEDLRRLVDCEFISRVAVKSTIYSIPVVQSNYYLNRAKETITSAENLDHALTSITTRRRENIGASSFTQGRELAVIAIDNLPRHEKQRYRKALSVAVAESANLTIIDSPTFEINSRFWAWARTFTGRASSHRLGRLINLAIFETDTDANILLLCNGALPAPGALSALQTIMDTSDEIAAVIPQQVLPQGTLGMLAHIPEANPHFSCDITLSCNYDHILPLPTFHCGRSVELDSAVTDCLFFKRKTWQLFNGFCARGERIRDIFHDFCRRIRNSSQMKIIYSPTAAVHLYTPGTRRCASQ